MKRYLLLASLFILSVLTLFTASPALARLGVGVGTGKIIVEEKLNPGVIYNLPIVSVLNTGDETAIYGFSVAYHQDQEELKPPLEWFRFSTTEFELAPGEVEPIEITLDLPLKAPPGKYFAYLEGFPKAKSESGETSISIAAATKLYFEVEPATLWEAALYKISSFWAAYRPWTDIVAGVVILLLVFNFLRERFDFNLQLKKKPSKGRKGSNGVEGNKSD
jgi:hypothetical protein